MREKIKAELDKMESQGVIRRIEEPTNWVSSLTYVTKRDNTIRVCLDPRALNKALIRPYHQIPTVKELNHRFAGAKFFSKLDAKLTYNKGSDNILADGLSRLPSPGNSDPIELDVRVDTVRFSSDRIEQLRNCTTADPLLNQLRETIITGWPETIKQLPTDIRVFWGLRDQLSIDDGLILKGQQIVIPQTLQDILKQLHTAHLGQEKTKFLAKDTVYWVNINRDIEQFTKSCSICQQHKPSQMQEPLMQHDIPTKPWDIVGTDLFDLHGSQWLIIANYYSKYPVVKHLPAHSPSSVTVNTTRQVFAEFGIPSKVVSDNGPHFSSHLYREFAKEWGFHHETTSPRRPQGNGFRERQIRTVKNILKKKAKKWEQRLKLCCCTGAVLQFQAPYQVLHNYSWVDEFNLH
ncbi:unnamed protein product [Acanthosepion pharaonis]|uniref:Integrase catalytic domain-containing protein n=1 Tax=Acanthosepion pharaonis TaxID=158019 RepID=A0A812BH00_ACAPH|nr:unnamed protein product [Sepia pharaonis]